MQRPTRSLGYAYFNGLPATGEDRRALDAGHRIAGDSAGLAAIAPQGTERAGRLVFPGSWSSNEASRLRDAPRGQNRNRGAQRCRRDARRGRHVSVPGTHRPPLPSGAGLQTGRAFRREGAAAAPPRRHGPAGVGYAPHPDAILGREKHQDRNPGPSGQGWGERSASRSRGLARPYRSGSGSPPPCCGPRTRTEAPPSSRQGTPRASRTPRTASVGSEAQRRPHQHQRQRGVDRPQAMPQGMLGTPLHLFPRPPGPSAPAPPRGRAGKRGGEGARSVNV